MRVHVVQTGRIEFKDPWLQATKFRHLLRCFFGSRTWTEIPIVAFVVEHPDGHIVVDTGISHAAVVDFERALRVLRRVIRVHVTPDDEIGPQMRKTGLRPEDVRWVVPTHLDVDHAGGVGHFPNAEILVHRPEYDYASTRLGKVRYQPGHWPTWFKPTLYDLAPEPYGSFPKSLRLADTKDVTLVPIPGHSMAQIAVAIKTDDLTLFFGGDHMIRQSWFVSDLRARSYRLQPHMKPNRLTTDRIREFVTETPTMILPSHDAEAVANLTGMEPIKL
jgi:glyoxylase-like metal-dependent hydrolase (beta-lactamase superfamily II)